jgi:carboxyl-terminal processing protease
MIEEEKQSSAVVSGGSSKPFWTKTKAVAVLIVSMFGSFAAGHSLNQVSIWPLHVASSPVQYGSLAGIDEILRRKFDGSVDDTKLLDGAKAGLVSAAGDPYTVYLDAKAAKQLSDDLSGSLTGIGAEIDIKAGVLTVVSPLADSPAQKAGILPADQILLIDEQDSSQYTLDVAVSKIRGKEGTTVKLKILHPGTKQSVDITITRAAISVPSVKSSMKGTDVGYIQVTRFGPDTSARTVEAAADLRGKGAKKIILDMRNNPGGYLDAGVSVASQFLTGGTLVVEERKSGKSIEKLNSTDGGSLVGLPAVVLINSGSASASEIVAGALHDNGVARLVGEKSFGKGSVQDITKLSGGAELKVTIAHWFTPKGVNINKEGIAPDVEVKMTTEDYAAGRDPQLDRALELLK